MVGKTSLVGEGGGGVISIAIKSGLLNRIVGLLRIRGWSFLTKLLGSFLSKEPGVGKRVEKPRVWVGNLGYGRVWAGSKYFREKTGRADVIYGAGRV